MDDGGHRENGRHKAPPGQVCCTLNYEQIEMQLMENGVVLLCTLN